MAERPLILLSNDDGFRAPGLAHLREALQSFADVVVCAPESEQSGTSHAISLSRPLRLLEHERGVFSVDGTPADCVFVALCAEGRVLGRTPDLVVSGINHGLNLGGDVFYSGTVAAAREGALRGLRGLALSAGRGADFAAAASYSRDIARAFLAADKPLIGGVLLNANFPPGNAWPVRGTRLGIRRYENRAEFRHDPRGGEYLWIGGPGVTHEGPAGSDTEAYDAGVVGITPLSLELWSAAQQPLADGVADAAVSLMSASNTVQ
ncbi:MAG: 5'/3'-nucleotidase SurE [Polyangiaceae bacterium]